jgi:benzoyl-CoA reductase/2-hydroxyglutaryl-CoA dehydratase subunit BcrC/BadD/HgdB
MNENAALTKAERQRDRFTKKSIQVSAKYLRRIAELPGMPEQVQPFLDVIRQIYIAQEPVRTDGRPCVGTYCMMVPQELIYAAGAVPVKLCSGSYTAFIIGDELVPRDACPLVKAVMGFCSTDTLPVYNDCAMMVIPITCDCKKKMAGMLQERIRTHVMHVPTAREQDEAFEICVGELYKLIHALEETTGSRITHRSLLESIRLVSRVQYEFYRFLQFKHEERSLIRGTHVITMMNALSFMPIDLWGEQLEKLNLELALRKDNGQYITRINRPRIMIAGSPAIFPNIKVPLLIEEMGGSLVADETCMGERFLYDPTVVVDNNFDGLVRALANRYFRACACPTFSDNTQRIYRIRQMAAEHHVQGIVYHVLRGCLVYDFEYSVIEEVAGEMNVPIIRVESDYNEEDIEQIRIRIEAFIELIKMKDTVREAL